MILASHAIAASVIAAIGLFDDAARADADSAANAIGGHDHGRKETQALASFQSGRELMAQKRYVEACGEFAKSQELDPAVGTMLNLGYCYEKLGKTASAWATYREAAVAARTTGRADWESGARERATYLEKGLLRVVIDVKTQTAGDTVSVLVDGTPLPKTVWGEQVPLYPGQHEVRANAANKSVWTTTFEVDAEHLPIVTVPVLSPIAVLSMAPQPVRGHPAESARNEDARRKAALLLGGSGVVALGIASTLGLVSIATHSNANCEPSATGRMCTQKGSEAMSRAHAEFTAAQIAAPLGGAAVVAAAILFVAGPSPRRGAQVLATVEGQSWGVALRGTW